MPLPTFARNGLCWELWGSLGFLRHKPTSPCRALCKPFSFFSSKLWHFGIVWPHCVMGTWTCLLITVGVTAWTLQVWTQSPKAYVLVVAGASPLKSDHDWRVSSCPHGARSGRVGAPTKPPMMLGAGRVLDSLFLLEQPETQEVVLPWPEEGRCGQCAAVSPTFHRSLPSIAVYLPSRLPSIASTSIAVYLPLQSTFHRSLSWSPWCWMWFSLTFPIPEFSPWCLVFEKLLVFFWEGQKSVTVCVTLLVMSLSNIFLYMVWDSRLGLI